MKPDNNLYSLYARIKRLQARMEIYGLKANQSNKKEHVILFKSLEYSLKAQAKRILLQIRGAVSDSDANIDRVIDQELSGLAEEYKKMKKAAEINKQKALVSGADHGKRVTSINRQISEKNRQGQVTASYHICDFCGYISLDKTPEFCPVCTAASRRFIEVSQ